MQISVDGARIETRVDGDGTRTIVLLHGFPFDGTIWNDVAAALASRARVVTIDQRGCGASSASPGPYLMDQLAGDVAAVMDALGIERATIAGHSMGGYVALAFARMYEYRLDGLALVCSTLAADTEDARKARFALADELERSQSVEQLVETYTARLFSKQTRERRPAVVDAARAVMQRMRPDAAAALLRGMAMRDAAHDIAVELSMPALVVAGAEDPLVSKETAQMATDAFSAGRLSILDGCDHVPMLEAPEALAAELGRLLDLT